ncbi:MAG TPA: branched-chain amino acid ABC transporter permease [Verrucomicrobiae bacterium]|nr:branched-chain amino acid ABC transporter permease [Verrucomicrobiae bacterium]
MKKLMENWIFRVFLFAVGLVLAGIVGKVSEIVVPPYYLNILLLCGINLIMALGLNLISGVTGQLSLGHAAFMSIGAYASALATVNYHAPFLVGVLIGGLVACLFGIIIGFPTLRLTGDYLAIATLGFAEIVRVQFLNMDITGGAVGLGGIKGSTNFPVVMVISVLTILCLMWLENSRNGRAMLAVREDEVASVAVGINTTMYKIQAFAIGAFCAGVGGALFAHTTTFIQPTDFGFLKSVEILSIVVLGGLGSIPGAVIGSVILTAAPEALRFMSNYRMLVYGLLLIVMMIFRPYGLMGGVDLRQLVRRALLLGKKKQVGQGA